MGEFVDKAEGEEDEAAREVDVSHRSKGSGVSEGRGQVGIWARIHQLVAVIELKSLSDSAALAQAL